MQQRHLLYIETIINAGSISKAANQLYVSQPYLSSYIKQIEQEWHLTLFNRKKRPISLTIEGEAYLKYLQAQQSLYQDFARKISNITNLKSGFLNLGVTPTLAFHTLHNILPTYMELFPNIKIKLFEGDSKAIEQYVLEGKVDLCLNTLPLWDKRINYTSLYTSGIYLVIPPQHRLYHQLEHEELTTEDIMKSITHERFIMLKNRYGLAQMIHKIIDDYHMEPDIVLETSNVDNGNRLAISTGTLTFVPKGAVEYNSNAIYIKMPEQYTNTVILDYKQYDQLSKAGKAFIDIATYQYNN